MTRCHICGDTGYWTGLTRPHGDPDPPAEYTGPRCTDREATAILSSHQDHPEHRPSLATMADGTCGCTLCRALRDLLDARRERDEARKALRWLAGAYAGMRDQPEAPKYVIATVRAAIAAARAAGGGEDE